MLLASGAVLHTAVATTQEPGRVYRVGIMAIIRREEGNWPASFDELARLGFVEGQNLRIEGRFSMPNEDAPEVAAALAGMALDAILTGGAWDTRAAQKATRTIPIQTVSDDVLQEGLVESLAHPGGNTTGISILATELDGKRQELLTDLVPTARQIAALAAAGVTPPEQLRALEDAARKHGIELSVHLASKPEEIVPAIEEARGSGAQALNVLAATLLNANRRLIIERAAAFKLPAIYQWPDMAEAGGLAAYGPNFNKLGGQRARQLVKLLQETKPADLPVEQPDKFELAINLRTARAIGLEVPAALLDLADKVIE